MKEELLRVLNVKLDDININIESLTDLNKKISKADDNLSYIKNMLDRFKEDDKYNVLNLTRFSSDEFSDILSLVRSDVSDIFKTKNCNYDGLVYLINGINNGVSLSLTIEQENAINYLISGMEELMRNDMAVVDGLNLVKTRFAIDDINVLEGKKNDFTKIITKLKDDKYIDEVDDICEAMEFSNLEDTHINEILVYLLKYNALIHEADLEKGNYEEIEEKDEEVEEKIETPVASQPIQEEDKPVVLDEKKDEIEFHLPEFNKIDVQKDVVVPTNYEVPIMPKVDVVSEDNAAVGSETIDYDKLDKEEDFFVPNVEINDDKDSIDEDFSDIVPQDDYEEYKPLDETISISPITTEKTSTREVQRLFQEFSINVNDSDLNKYLNGDVQEYRKVINVLKSNGILDNIVDNKDLFREIIVNTHENEIINALNIIKNDLSIDNEDYDTTVNIAIDTIPSIFVSNGGNYNNFVENVKLFKELGINLVSLFDFSKEVFVANHDVILKNYEIVKEYDINIDYKNAKYFLLLNDIATRMDYYVESIYKDEIKKDTFDGYKFIKEFPSKLNVVTDETIKRLRYASENNKKVLGSKPGSLTGEITNLKVNVLELPSLYLDNFFNNEFDNITEDEVRQYVKLCNNSSNVGDFYDELSDLEKYHNGIRYSIEGINIYVKPNTINGYVHITIHLEVMVLIKRKLFYLQYVII